MKIAVVADIHGNLLAIEAVSNDIKRHGVDMTVNLGDSLSGALLPLETAQFLMDQDWVHLAGNHERQLLTQAYSLMGVSDQFTYSQLGSKELAWLSTLKSNQQLTSEVLLCHGTPNSDLSYFLETVEPTGVRMASQNEIDQRLGDVSVEMILCGHTHIPRVMRATTGQNIVNPGSVGLPAFDDIHPYPHAIETGSPDARYAIIERLAGRWISQLIAVPYAYQTMAALAHRQQRPDWSRILLTGRV